MRIVVNNVAASSGGALSVLKSFYTFLVNSDKSKEDEWIFLLSGRYIEETDNIKVIILDQTKKNWLSRLNFDLYSGKNFISKLNPDIVFSLQNTITFGLKCPQVLYMHQSIPFQKVKKFSFFKSEERILAIYQYILGRFIKESIKKADKTVVQTKWIKNAVIDATKVSSNRIINVLPPLLDVSNYKRENLFQNNLFFYPSAKSVYKNHKCIFDACDILGERGINNYNISLTIAGESTCNLTYLDKKPFEWVLRKYNESILIFPSYIESVGLPLMEARQIGTIILAADCPFSREVLEGYENAYFFNPFNPDQLADLMEKLITKKINKLDAHNKMNFDINSWKYVVDLIKEVSGEKS